jgi:predicted peptidase
MLMKYWLYLPKDYEAKAADRFPLLLFLHGSGECGTDLEKVKLHGPPMLISKGREFPFIVVSPQHDTERAKQFFWPSDVLTALLDDLEKKYRIDTEREYVTGLSLGGEGTWSMAVANPKRFAAIAPIAGWHDVKDADKLVDTPVWAFHGEKDTAVKLTIGQEIIDAVKRLGGDVKFSVTKDGIHNVWTKTYEGDDLYKWFLRHRRKPSP